MSKRLTKKTADGAEVNFTFKLLSAVGIIIIVAGHNHKGGFMLFSEWFPFYSFNISLFAFISGYFYDPRHEKTPGAYLLKRAKRLILPAFVWNMVYAAIIFLLKNFGYSFFPEINLFNLFVMPFTDGEAFYLNLGSWFVYPLFLVCAVNVLFRKLLKAIHADNEWIFFLMYLVIGMTAVYLSINEPSLKTEFKLFLRAGFMLPMYQLGRLYRARLERLDRLGNLAYFAAVFVIQLIILTCFEKTEYTPSKMTNFANGIILPYITSVTGTAFWLRVCRIIAPAVQNRKAVLLIADNTYSIMIHHLFAFFCVKWLFFALNSMFGLFADFNASYLRQVFWYWYLPKSNERWAVIYLAAGIAVPVAIKKACDILLEKIKNLSSNVFSKAAK